MLVKQGDVNEMNVPCTQFTDALGKGLLERDYLIIDGVNFHVAAKDLGMLSASRYYYVLSTQEYYKENGIDPKTDSEYLLDLLEQAETIRGMVGVESPQNIREAFDKHITTLKVYSYHKTNVNMLYMMLDFVATCLIVPCENPYDIDEKIQLKKMDIFNTALASERRGEFLAFFQIYLEQKGKDFLKPLKEFINSTLLKPMTPAGRKQKEYLVALDILEQKEALELLKNKTSSRKQSKISRMLYNLVSLKQEMPEFSSLLNTA